MSMLSRDTYLNIYGQPIQHVEARIAGNKQGLEALSRAILRALADGKSTTGPTQLTGGLQIGRHSPDQWGPSTMKCPITTSSSGARSFLSRVSRRMWWKKNGAGLGRSFAKTIRR